jgi:hypothetical protein
MREARSFAEKQDLTPAQLAELLSAVDEVERRLIRHGSPLAQLRVHLSPAGNSLDWTASPMRISGDDSRAAYVGPLPQTQSRVGPLPTSDQPVSGGGWQWLERGQPQAVLLERPHPRETLSGDMILVERSGGKLRVAVADGLGHGPMAREAATRAVQSLQKDIKLDIEESVMRAHERLAATRGATLGLVDIDLVGRTIRGTTVGNVRVALFFGAGRVWSPCGTDAVLGHGRGGSSGRLTVRVEQHPYPSDSVLALFSDGLLNQLRMPWQRGDLDDLVIQLFHTFSIANDDATLLLLG